MKAKIKSLFISCSFVFTALILLVSDPAMASQLTYIDFESSDVVANGADNSYYNARNKQTYTIQQQGPRTYLGNWISTSMAHKGKKSMGAWLKTPPPPTTANWKDDPKWEKQRVEFEFSNRNYHTQHLEETRYYGFAVYVHPQSPDVVSNGGLFMQAWQSASPGKHPALALRLEDNTKYQWSVKVSRDSSTNPDGAVERIYFSDTGLAKGVWHEFVVMFKPSVQSKGALRVWHNGSLAVSQTSQRNFGYKPRSSNPVVNDFFSIRCGLYRQPEPDKPGDLILMFDQIKLGTSYEDVDP